MKKIYQRHLNTASILDDTTKLMYLMSVLRSLLHLAVVSSFEIIKARIPSDEIDLGNFAERLRNPTDGLCIEIIDKILPWLRTYIDNQFMYGWYESSKWNINPIGKDLLLWVEFRNSRPGHGVLDKKNDKEGAIKTEQLIQACLNIFDIVIPSIEKDEKLKLSKLDLYLKTPILKNKEAIVITKIIVNKGLWKLKGQILSRDNAEEITFDLPENNIFSQPENKREIYGWAEITVNNKKESFRHNIPIRQTENFEGRFNELKKLEEWLNDDDSTRLCLIFGDGGYGKTTLVLELLNQIMEDKIDLNKKPPFIISYYTAKMTRWTDKGIEHFKSALPVMEESIRELMKYDNPVLTKDWYTISGKALIDKARTVLTEEKLTRDDILLVFDNTETLATSTQEVNDLAQFFNMVGKNIGRVIITSRRREYIAATPIEVEGLSEEESLSLIKRLADEYKASSILQSGESTRRKICKQLMYKPLLIEALVKYISRSNSSIDAALDNIFKKSNDALLEFLYEDAWVRMNEGQQKVFLVLVSISCPLDNYSVSNTCQEVGIPQTEFEKALDETYFSALTNYGTTYTLEIADLAKRFFQQKFGKYGEEAKQELNRIIDKVNKNAVEREKIEKEYKSDRVAEAFRSHFAKAAKNCVDKGDIKEAIEMFELAIEEEPLNSALHDRFALFLFQKVRDYEYAMRMAKKAFELDSKNSDAIVTIALIYYQIGNISEGDKHISSARKNGRTDSFCLLRKAIARYHKAKNDVNSDKNLEESIKYLEEAFSMLKNAKNKDMEDKYYAKNELDINKYLYLTEKELKECKNKIGRA